MFSKVTSLPPNLRQLLRSVYLPNGTISDSVYVGAITDVTIKAIRETAQVQQLGQQLERARRDRGESHPPYIFLKTARKNRQAEC